jgi:hypothetical protein
MLWVLAYDDYPMTSIPEKQKWQTFAAEKDAWLIFYHDFKAICLRFAFIPEIHTGKSSIRLFFLPSDRCSHWPMMIIR